MTIDTELLPVNTRVAHFGGGPNTHGLGTIVAHNTRPVNQYLAEGKVAEAAEIAAATGLLGALVNSFYDGARCPYVVQWDNGYKDVYEHESLTIAEVQNA